jgi:8-oxo-dGTP diphosphatase
MLEKEPGTYLITQRSKNASLPLLWEFPGGRVNEGEKDKEALVRELHERLELDVTVGEQAMATHHVYPDYEVDFTVFFCSLKNTAQPVSHKRVNDHRWVRLDQMSEYEFPPADARTLEKLLELDH